jgi:hypothetical protein
VTIYTHYFTVTLIELLKRAPTSTQLLSSYMSIMSNIVHIFLSYNADKGANK